jgi:hypothetical protein
MGYDHSAKRYLCLLCALVMSISLGGYVPVLASASGGQAGDDYDDDANATQQLQRGGDGDRGMHAQRPLLQIGDDFDDGAGVSAGAARGDDDDDDFHVHLLHACGDDDDDGASVQSLAGSRWIAVSQARSLVFLLAMSGLAW